MVTVNKLSPEEAQQVAWAKHITEELVRQWTLETGREARVDGIRSNEPQRKGEGDAVYEQEYSESVRAVMENQERARARTAERGKEVRVYRIRENWCQRDTGGIRSTTQQGSKR